jgi:hypothetical protein
MTQRPRVLDKHPLHDLEQDYGGDDEHPLGGYLTLMGTFIGLFVAFLGLVRYRRLRLPEGFGTRDLILFGIATHHFGRILTKAGVTSPLRAPFTEFKGQSDPPAEVMESVRGPGLRHAVGELVTCPFCLSLWIAAFFSYGRVISPRVTRLVASIFVIDAISDNLNLLYDATARAATRAPEVLDRSNDRSPAAEK